jgi:serine/threonine protein kinase
MVIHRDLKSLNVVLSVDSEPKLCDWGWLDAMHRTHLTVEVVGSFRWMPPEMLVYKVEKDGSFTAPGRESRVTEKVDIWALGCLFWEIFARQLPFAGMQMDAQVLDAMRMGICPANLARLTHLPPAVNRVLVGCFNSIPACRPGATEIHTALMMTKPRAY